MESYKRKDIEEGCPKLLDLIPKDRKWLLKMKEEEETGHEEKKLELSLGPPGGEWTNKHNTSLLSFPCFSNNTTTSGTKRGFIDTVNGNSQGQGQAQKLSWSSSCSSSVYQGKSQEQQTKASFLNLHQSTSSSQCLSTKESSQHCCSKVELLQQSAEKKAFSSPSAAANTAVPNNSSSAQKRIAPAPVVGWPPIRSSRKNLANSCSNLKPSPESSNKVAATNEKPVESNQKSLFVKINMDGVPIGRKVDLKAFDGYEKLSSAVDELFRGLLAAQGDTSARGIQIGKGEEKKVITGLLDGSGEYTLVYEDNEGDRMLVGDVPWHMFVSTVKRLRVLKSSEISTMCRGSNKQGKLSLNAASK